MQAVRRHASRQETSPRLGQDSIRMQGKVTLEDHFAIEATLGDSQPFGAHVWPELRHRLLDFHDQRLRLMDASGVEIMIVSLIEPAILSIANSQRRREVAREL